MAKGVGVYAEERKSATVARVAGVSNEQFGLVHLADCSNVASGYESYMTLA